MKKLSRFICDKKGLNKECIILWIHVLKQMYQMVKWSSISGLRDRAAHGYQTLEMPQIWTGCSRGRIQSYWSRWKEFSMLKRLKQNIIDNEEGWIGITLFWYYHHLYLYLLLNDLFFTHLILIDGKVPTSSLIGIAQNSLKKNYRAFHI